MTNNSDKKIAQTEAEYAQKIVQQYRNIISETPLLLSLLYDADLLPEQIRTVRNAISMSSVVIAYKEGKNATSAALAQSRAETAAAYEWAARICEDRNDEIWDRDTGEKIGLDGAAEKIRALTPADAIAARDRMIADAEARGMREVAAIAEKGVEILGLRMREAKDKKEKLNWQSMLFCAVDIKQAILAAIPKGGDA